MQLREIDGERVVERWISQVSAALLICEDVWRHFCGEQCPILGPAKRNMQEKSLPSSDRRALLEQFRISRFPQALGFLIPVRHDEDGLIAPRAGHRY